MNVCQKLCGESEVRPKFLEAISSVKVLEVSRLEIAALATLPTLFFLEDAKQQWKRKRLQAYSAFVL